MEHPTSQEKDKMKIETTNLTRKYIRIRLFKRYVIYLSLPIRINYLAASLGGKNRQKPPKWSDEKKLQMSKYMQNDWWRRKSLAPKTTKGEGKVK